MSKNCAFGNALFKYIHTPAKKFLGKECNKYDDDENFFANGFFTAHLERNKWIKWARDGW